jgi:caa(3)-type oxidase subunit IV
MSDTTDSAAVAEHDDPGHHDHTRKYVKIWAILLVLLCISVAGPELEIQIVTLVTAFGIAIVKAYMVAKEFMHLNVEKPVVHWFLATALVFMVLLFAGLAPDVMKHEGSNWTRIQTLDPGVAALTHHGGDHAAAGDHATEGDPAEGGDHGAQGAGH